MDAFNLTPIYNYEEPDLDICPRFDGKCVSAATAPPSVVEEPDPNDAPTGQFNAVDDTVNKLDNVDGKTAPAPVGVPAIGDRIEV